MDQQGQTVGYWEIIKYGIDTIGREVDINSIKKTFEGRARVAPDEFDNNMELWAVNHAYLGQEHLCLNFEQDNYFGVVDFDLMPKNQLVFLQGETKRLVNFKAQLLAKKVLLWCIPLTGMKTEILSNLKNLYGLPNNYERFSQEKKIEFEKAAGLLHRQYEELGGVDPKDVNIWYIEKDGIYYLTAYYYFKGKKDIPPYVSFAITEVFKFDEIKN
jgi:hypothetical protein